LTSKAQAKPRATPNGRLDHVAVGGSQKALEPNIADQTSGNLFAADVVAAVDEAGPVRFAPRVFDVGLPP
jgi:hypothetical protein